MKQKLARRRLLRKDLRLALPLVALLIVLGVLVQVSFGTRGRDVRAMALDGLPVLFAVGAGALLIGQEKELRTLCWLSTMPIPRRDLMIAKLSAGLIGLAVMWVASLMLWMLASDLELANASPHRFWTVPSNPLEWATCLMNTLFILLAGVLLAWQLKSAMLGLLAVLPIALLPSGLAGIASGYFDVHPGSADYQYWLLGFQIACSVAALWVGWRTGLRCLGPESPAGSSLLESGATYKQRYVAWRIPQPSFGALIWQYAFQTRATLIGTAAMLATALVLVTRPRGEAALGSLLALIAVSWLGASVFLSDRLQQRIEFLAVRGVSAGKTWATRQAMPLCLVLLTSLIASQIPNKVGMGSDLLTLLCIVGFLLMAYVVSQWTGQVVRSPIVGAVASPAIVAAVFGYTAFATSVVGAPIWSFVIVGLLPMITTLLVMRRWMDSRYDLVYWATHAGCLFAFIMIPLLPVGWVLTEPTMSRDTDTELIEEAQRWPQLPSPQELVFTWKHEQDEPESISLDVRSKRQMAKLAQEMSSSSAPLKVNWKATDFLMTEAALSRFELEENSEQSAEQTSRYRDAVRTLVAYVKRLRQSDRLVDQDSADCLEIWLLKELKRTEARRLLGPSLITDAVELLSDSDGRTEARRRAVALSWRKYQHLAKVDSRYKFGGYSFDRFDRRDSYSWRVQWAHERDLHRIVACLWSMAAGNKSPTYVQHRQTLADFWRVPASEYGLGKTGAYLRADDFEKVLIRPRPICPATQWCGEWEREAAAFKST